ncbi:MAG: sugar phosphate nucleotidyltransferase [bacterium]
MKMLSNVLINPGMELPQVLKRLNDAGSKILFVVNDENKLLGVVTDGDIRRWIVNKNKLESPVSEVMNKNPIFVKEQFTLDEIKELMVVNRVDCIPVVDKNNKVLTARWWIDLFSAETREYDKLDADVAIMAGGRGSRLSPFTRIIPKPLIPINEKPIIERIIENFAKYGCKEFYVSIFYKANMVRAHFDYFEHDYVINYIEEKEPLGTIGSLYMIKNNVSRTIFVTNCDILIEADYADILKFHRENKNKVTLVSSMKSYTIHYGVCELGDGGKLKKIKEKPEYNFLVNTGMYLLEPEVIKDIPDNKLHHITELINNYIHRGENVGVYPVLENSWLDVGQWEDIQETLKRFG